MWIQTEYGSVNNLWTINSSYDIQAHQQHSQRCSFPRLYYSDLRFSQTCCRLFQVLLGMSLALPELALALPCLSPVLPGPLRCNVGRSTPRYTQLEVSHLSIPLSCLAIGIDIWTYTRTNRWFTSKLHSGAESELNRMNVERLSNPNILSRLVLTSEKLALHTSGESRGLYTSFICALTRNSYYTFL